MSEVRLSKEDIQSMIDDQVKALDESTALYEPDQYAGNILVDPVIIAALSYWWTEYKKRQMPELTVLREKEILESLIGASIPPSVDYEIEHLVAQAQLAHTKRELGE